MTNLCSCGCGHEIPLLGKDGKPNRLKNYLKGHRKTIKAEMISCVCGCGKNLLNRDKENRERKYLPYHHDVRKHLRKYWGKKGCEHPSWNGGRVIDDRGYVRIHKPEHPFSDNHGHVYEHRLVMEDHLNANLLPWAVVHHINGNRWDNRIENLQLTDNSKHMKLHKVEVQAGRTRYISRKMGRG